MSGSSEIASDRFEGSRPGLAQPSSFSYQHYNGALRSFKSRALGWFVQFAIRGELHKAYEADWELDENEYRARPYLKLRGKSSKLRDLICRKHIIDEFDLAGIGMTLYDFPILFTFFGAGDFRNYVREPTVVEITRYLSEMFQMIEDAPPDLDLETAGLGAMEIGSRIKHLTRTQVEELVGRKGDASSSARRLICVNMSAPVSVLKAQFLEILERSAKEKNEIEVMIQTWMRYGVLSFIDLRDRVARDGMQAVSVARQIKLIYDPELARRNKEGEEIERGAKTLNETTKPHALRMMDFQSQPFCALAAAASREFNDAVLFARDPNASSNREACREALRRWIPKTYPYCLTAIELAMEVEPERAEQLQAFLEHLKRGDQLTCSLEERIKNCSSSPDKSVWTAFQDLSFDDDIDLPRCLAREDELELEFESEGEDERDWFKSLLDGDWNEDNQEIDG